MKKKIIVLLSLVLVICSFLCACGSGNAKSDVKNDLLGEWSYQFEGGKDITVTRIYVFDEDIVTTYTHDNMGGYEFDSEPIEKQYSIKKDTVVMGDTALNYSYENGKLRLFTKEGNELHKTTEEQESDATNQGITEEDIEQVAMLKVYNLLQSEYEFHCNPEKTTYSIGTIRQTDDDEYNVKGKLTLYDDYGNLAYFATFDVDVDVDSNGNLRAGFPKIELE